MKDFLKEGNNYIIYEMNILKENINSIKELLKNYLKKLILK